MTMAGPLQFEILHSIHLVGKSAWDELVDPDFPFASFDFLHAMETTGCLGPRTGWLPIYLIAKTDGKLVAAMLLYLKDNSYGEFIFDFSWAQAYAQGGFDYYPKLLSAIPFTPATGTKIWIARPSNREQVFSALLEEAQRMLKDFQATSLHFLFVPKQDLKIYKKAGLFLRDSYQYHWKNQGYKSFEDFLNALTSKRRREVLRERRQVQQQGISIRNLSGPEVLQYAPLMYDFYESTIRKMGGFPYLTKDFFAEVFKKMHDKILLVMAFDPHDQPVAGALNFFGGQALYGRYWGCLDEYKSLHFEVCYYQGIQFCIENELALFEAGAQGEHKFQRGFLPEKTYSAHLIDNPLFDRPIRDFVRRESLQIEQLINSYKEHSPFREQLGQPGIP